MKRDTLPPASLSDLTQDKHKRTRAKSPTVAKTKQTYLQNLEKKLDELLTVSTNDKKNMTGAFNKQTELNPNSKFDSYQDGKRQKKVALCKVYMALKTCKKGDSCPFAHGHKQLDVEYKPVEWVRIFKQSSSHSIRGLNTAQGKRPYTGMTTTNANRPVTGMSSSKSNFGEGLGFMRANSPSPRSYQQAYTTMEERDGQVNKVVNTKGRTLLIEATVMNDLQSIKTLMKKGASVSQRDWLGNDSLFYAIKNSNPVLLETLIKYSLEPVNLDEQFTISKFSYLILAAKMGSAKMLEILLKYGAKPNISDRYNRTALFYCVEKNFRVGVELLLSYSIDINPVDTYGKTVLDYAYEKNLFDILDILIRAGGSSADTAKNKLLLLICAQYNLKESVHELLKRGMSPNEVDENGNNMLMVAYESGNIELLEVVIKEYSLRSALNQKNKRGDNLILRAVKDQNESFTRSLLHSANVDFNAKDETGKTLLMYACESGDYEIVDFLISKGVNLESVDKYGRTALIFACKSDHVLVVETLLKYTLKPLWKDYLGKSASQYTSNGLIKGLLKHYIIENNILSESQIKELEEGNQPVIKNTK